MGFQFLFAADSIDNKSTRLHGAGEALNHPSCPSDWPADAVEAMADSTTAAAAAAAAEAKTSVWWDINWCAVPPGCGDPHRIAHNVIAALAAAGCKGPVSFFAYGDASRIAPGVLEALSSTGISLDHVSAGIDPLLLIEAFL